MTKLRNIGYLLFASKIRQGFAVATPSLTPTSLLFPLWMLFAVNAGGGGPRLLYWGGEPAAPPAGRQGPPCDKTEILITYKPLSPGRGAGGRPPRRWAAGPCRPPAGR